MTYMFKAQMFIVRPAWQVEQTLESAPTLISNKQISRQLQKSQEKNPFSDTENT